MSTSQRDCIFGFIWFFNNVLYLGLLLKFGAKGNTKDIDLVSIFNFKCVYGKSNCCNVVLVENSKFKLWIVVFESWIFKSFDNISRVFFISIKSLGKKWLKWITKLPLANLVVLARSNNGEAKIVFKYFSKLYYKLSFCARFSE